MKRFLVATFFLLWTASIVSAQSTGQNIRGQVVDAFTGIPIEGSVVLVIDSGQVNGSTTDSKGEFTIKNVAPGRRSFSASIIGYKTQVVSNLMVMNGKETVINFQLEEKATTLGEVVVKAPFSKEKALNDMALVSARSFSVEETERFAGSLGDPARMVSNYAGVMAGNDSRNDIIIRGNSPVGLLWRIEGVEVPNPNHFGSLGTTGGPVSMLNQNLLTNSDFMTGAFPSEYGNALSGVFDINLRSGNKDKFEFTGQVGFNGFELAAEGPIWLGKDKPKGSFIIDYRYSTMELVNKLGFDFGTGTAIPKYKDLTIITDIPTRKMGRFKFIGIYGNSFIQLGRSFDKAQAISSNQVGYATDFGALLSVSMLTHTLIISENSKLKSALSYQTSQSATQNDSIDYEHKTYFSTYAGSLSENKLSASTELKHRFDTHNNLKIGLIYNRYITTFNDSSYLRSINKRIILSDINHQSTTLMEAYTNMQHKFTDDLMLNGGLHYKYYDLSNESTVEPRLGFQWHVSESHTFSLGYGMHSQIQPRTVYFAKEYDTKTSTYSENNHQLESTKAQHYVLGYDWHLGNEFRIKSEAYYQNIYNVPVSKENKVFSMLNDGSAYYIAKADSLVNTGNGYNVGIELTLEKFLSNNYYALMTLSLFDSKYQGFDKVCRNTAFDTNYAINLLAGYELKVGKNNFLTFDIRNVWSGGMRYIPIDLSASIASNQQVYDWSNAYRDKFNDYLRLDIRIGFKKNSKHITEEWGLDLQNVTNHQNVFSQQYNPLTHSISTVYQRAFFPMMLYRINF
jgi:TonB dependent receptor/Carboxypeptidase regulatory-like domain